jgi:hypothetical protein
MIDIVVLPELNVAVSRFWVPAVVPGTIAETQFVAVCRAPVLAVELQVPVTATIGFPCSCDLCSKIVNLLLLRLHRGYQFVD